MGIGYWIWLSVMTVGFFYVSNKDSLFTITIRFDVPNFSVTHKNENK